MLFQMLAGVLPSRGDSMAELMYKIANEPAPDIRVIRPELSARLADIVALSLSKMPETRYQDGDQFAADLRAAIAEQSAVPAGPAVPAGALAPSPEGSEKTVAFAAGDNPAFARTIAARSLPDPLAGVDAIDLKP